MIIERFRIIFTACVILLIPAAAEAAPARDSVRVLRDVEVLGVKQMPQAGVLPVSKFSRAQINRLGITAVKNLGELVPNLYTPAYGSKMTSSIYMRGLGSRIDQPVVGLSVDGVPFLNKDAYDSDLPFINSIEVLRGAQSVLNGRNAMAGQINIYTLSPRDVHGYRLRLEYGRANSMRVDAGAFLRLNDKVATSITGLYNHTDGYWHNAFDKRRVGVENNGTLRWKTVFSPSSTHTITNTMAFSLARQHGYPYRQISKSEIDYNDPCNYRRNFFSDGITVAWAGKRVVVNSLTSVQYLDDCMTLDQDFTRLDYFTLTQRRHEFTFTEDLFAKGTRGKYSWLGGVFGFARHTRMWAPVTFHDTGIARLIEDKRNQMNPTYPITWDERQLWLGSDFTNPARGIALYHQSTFHCGKWTLDAGLRLETEYVGCSYHSDADASYTTWHDSKVFSVTPVNIHDKGHMSQTFTQLLPRLTVSRSLGSGEIYVSLTKGYKSGGFNSQMFSDVLQQRLMSTMGLSMTYSPEDIVRYKPETSWNYEAGISFATADGSLSGSLTGFLIQCRDQQLTVFPPGTVTGRVMTNAGRTLSKGVELSGRWNPSDNLIFNVAYGFTDARFQKYFNGKEDFKGKRVPYAPSNTLWCQLVWHTPWRPAGLSTTIDGHVRAAGSIMWDEANTFRQPFYALPGASFTLSASRWSLKLWGENLSSTNYAVFCFTSIGNTFEQRGAPLTWGATFALDI